MLGSAPLYISVGTKDDLLITWTSTGRSSSLTGMRWLRPLVRYWELAIARDRRFGLECVGEADSRTLVSSRRIISSILSNLFLFIVLNVANKI